MNPRDQQSQLPDMIRFLGRISDEVAGAKEPIAAIRQIMPEIAALIGVQQSELQMVDPEHAAIEISFCGDIAGLSEVSKAFLSSVTVIARQAAARAELNRHMAVQKMIAHDLDEAVLLQQSLQPQVEPEQLPIWGMNLPARILSGDFFDFYRLDKDRIIFTLGDVSGKGIDAALLMAKAVTLFRCLGKMYDTPAELLVHINSELCENSSRGLFVTMVCGIYHPQSGNVCFANAGHQPPLLRKLDRSYDEFPAQAPPLGILPEIEFVDEQLELDGGEFYLFTDGLTEYRYGDGEMLGVHGLIQLFEVFGEGSPADRLRSILDTLNSEEGWQAQDDLTVLTINDSWVRHTGIAS